MQAQYEHEHELKSKTQLEQQLQGWHSERKETSEKLDHVTQELQCREKEFLADSHRKEQLEGTLARKEELWETMKGELQQKRIQLNDKLEGEAQEVQQTVGRVSLSTRYNNEKSIALSTQQYEFCRKNVQELEKQLEVSA
jgi:hypothetical protein